MFAFVHGQVSLCKLAVFSPNFQMLCNKKYSTNENPYRVTENSVSFNSVPY